MHVLYAKPPMGRRWEWREATYSGLKTSLVPRLPLNNPSGYEAAISRLRLAVRPGGVRFVPAVFNMSLLSHRCSVISAQPPSRVCFGSHLV
jgi:hypothetical protein